MGGSIIDELVKSIQQDPGQSNKSVSAVVSRTDDDGVVWVRLAGSDQDTPTESISAEVKPGDAVTVEWRNKRLYVAGNYSNPAAGVERVQIAEENVSAATKVINTVKKAVDIVAKIAGNTAQYFWHMETGTDTGVHITEIPKDDFLADPANGGGNLLARSNGIAVRDGLTELSRFGADGVQIGQDGQTRAVIGSNSLRLISKEGSTYFHVSDLRNIGDNVEESFTSNGASSNYTLTCAPDEPSERNTVVTVNGVPQKWGIGADSDYPYVISFHVGRYPFGLLEFTDAIPPGGADIVVRYPPLEVPIAFTFGSRASGFPIGDISAVIGRNCEASWPCSFAQGLGTKTGDECQAVFGTYNDPSDGLLVIGNGTDDSNRSNALTVDWNGFVKIYNPNITVDTTPSSNNSNMAVQVCDKDGSRIGHFGYNYSTDGKIGVSLQGYRNVNGTNHYNTLNLLHDTSGNAVVSFSNPAAWRTGLGLSNILDMIKVVEFKKTNVSIGANTSLSPVTITATEPTGFSFVSIVGWRIDTTDTTSGANSASCVVTNYWGTTTLNATVRNFASSAAKVTVNLKVLFLRNTL